MTNDTIEKSTGPSSYKNIWEYRVKEAFKKEGSTSSNTHDILWDIVSLLLYSNTKDKILVDIFNFFEDKNDFVKFISMMDGRSLKIPTKMEIEEALLTAMFFYEKEIKGQTWKEIQESLDFTISPIKYGIKIKNLQNWLRQKIQEILHRRGI